MNLFDQWTGTWCCDDTFYPCTLYYYPLYNWYIYICILVCLFVVVSIFQRGTSASQGGAVRRFEARENYVRPSMMRTIITFINRPDSLSTKHALGNVSHVTQSSTVFRNCIQCTLGIKVRREAFAARNMMKRCPGPVYGHFFLGRNMPSLATLLSLLF